MLVVAHMVEVEGRMNYLGKSEYFQVTFIILLVLQRKPIHFFYVYMITKYNIEFGTERDPCSEH